jgi:chromosome segregation ATPase
MSLLPITKLQHARRLLPLSGWSPAIQALVTNGFKYDLYNSAGTPGVNVERLRSSMALLESALKERSKQIEIQAKENNFLRKELRRKDSIINDYDTMLKQYKFKENQELGKLRKEVGRLRHMIMNSNMLIREHENRIDQLKNKNEKLMSVMKPQSCVAPRMRAQGVSAPPMTFSAESLKRWQKNARLVGTTSYILLFH